MHQVASAQALIQRARAQTAHIKNPEVAPSGPVASEQSPGLSKPDKKGQVASGIENPSPSSQKAKVEEAKEKMERNRRKRASTPGLSRNERLGQKKKARPEQAEKKDADEVEKPRRRNS